jgi:thiamine transport system permease protein
VRLSGEASVRSAGLTSLTFATLSALFAVLLSLALIGMRRDLERDRRRGHASLLERAADTGAGFVLVVPPIVIGAGWFVLFRHVGDVFLIAPVMVVAVNAVMAMPFVVRAIRPAHDAAAERHDRLATSLGISGWNRFHLIDWPSIRRPLATGFAFAMALSLGDLGVIALFGSDAVKTLPYLLLERMGSYRTVDAAGLALIIALICLALMTLADHLGRERR